LITIEFMATILENPKSSLKSPLETGPFVRPKEDLSRDELAALEATEGASQKIETSQGQTQKSFKNATESEGVKLTPVAASPESTLAEVGSGAELSKKEAFLDATDLAKFLSGDKNFDTSTLGTDMDKFLESAKDYAEKNQN